MDVLSPEANEIHAKIVFYGPAGSGKTQNVEFIHKKLKRDHRGDLRVETTRAEPKASYEFLPVQLGQVRGYQTSIHLHTVPGADVHDEERRQMLDGVDGVVFVADLRPERHETTLASLEELKKHLQGYGRSLDDVILLVQYNHRDEADENALEALHGRMQLKPAATFEANASHGTGVLQCLTTISKLLLTKLRREAEAAGQEDAGASEEPSAARDEVDTAAEPAEGTADAGEVEPPAQAPGFSIAVAGPAECAGGEIRVPIRLVEEESGREVDLNLRLTLGP